MSNFLEFLLSNQNDIALNLISAIPFAIFDLLVIAFVLPITIEILRDYRRRKIRAIALQSASGAQRNAIRELARELDRNNENVSTTQLTSERKAVIKEYFDSIDNKIYEQKMFVNSQLPVYMSIMNEEDQRITVHMQRRFESVCWKLARLRFERRLSIQFSTAISELYEKLDHFDIGYKAIEERQFTLMRKRYKNDPAISDEMKQSVEHMSDVFDKLSIS